MPSAHRTLSSADVARVCAEAFAPCDVDQVGLEVEWSTRGGVSPDGRPTSDVLDRIEPTALPAGGRVTWEPGGQVELSTAPHPDVGGALAAARADGAALHALLAREGYACRTTAVDVERPPRRILERPRYRAMERHFGSRGPAGAWMMCNTASTQVNLSHAEHDPFERWHLLNTLAPVLVAAFACSPGVDATGRRWASLRQGVWASIDPSRTRPVGTPGERPPEAWARYALAADVMQIGEGVDGEPVVPAAPGLSLARWIDVGHTAGWPTERDLRYHLSTLFPPIRPRGWLEVRVLDALPDRLREACALTIATACTREASRELLDRLPPTAGLGLPAARHGLTHPTLARAALVLADVVVDHRAAVSTDPAHLELVDELATRYLRAGRSPADDLPPVRLPISLDPDDAVAAG